MKRIISKIIESEKTTAIFLSAFFVFLPLLSLIPQKTYAVSSIASKFLYDPEIWTLGSAQPIVWETTGVSTTNIDLYKEGVFDRNVLTSHPTVDGNNTYSFVVPSDLETAKKYSFRMIDSNDSSVFVDTDSIFIVVPAPLSIDVTNPAGGEIWTIGDTYNLNWATTGVISDIVLYLCDSVATSTCNILSGLTASGTPNTGTYSWTIDSGQIGLTPGGSFVIRAENAVDNTLYDLSGVFTINNPAPAITATFLYDPEIWTLGSTQPISWNATSTANIDIELYKEGVFDRIISTSTPTSPNTISFVVPNDLETGKKYSFKIKSSTDPLVFDETDSFFVVVPAPLSIDVTNPAGGEIWTIGDTYNLNWATTGVISDIVLYLCDSVATSTCNILSGLTASGTPNTGTYSWTIDSGQIGLTPGGSFVIRAENAVDNTLYDLSGVFTINNPVSPPPTPPSGGGGGGGGNGPIQPIVGFWINNEKVTEIDYGTVLISWNTNKESDSQVFYDEIAKTFNFGDDLSLVYALKTEKKIDNLFEHGMIIKGLKSNTNYYFRPTSNTISEKAVGMELTLKTRGVIVGTSCEYLKDPMRLNLATNNREDVIKLQTYLKNYENRDIEVTGIFDEKTDQLVREYQEKYKGQILTPWGSEIPTGYVYLTTRKHINETVCKREFPLTTEQATEIARFRALIESGAFGTTTAPNNFEIGLNTGERNSPTKPNNNIANNSETRNNNTTNNTNTGTDKNNSENLASPGGLLNIFGLNKTPIITNEDVMASSGATSNRENISKNSALGTLTSPIIGAPKIIMLGIERLLNMVGL